MKTTHTKGEWFLTTDGEANFFGISANKNWLMRVQQNGELSLQEEEANAKLIAAAPELLETLILVKNEIESMVDNIKCCSNQYDDMMDLIDLTIKKATE